MARLLALGLAAAVLPACGENKIWVQNEGGSDARVDVYWTTDHEDPFLGIRWTEDHDDSWLVSPGQSAGKSYPSSVLEVRIVRASDGLTLFEDDFEYEDFRDEHSRIEITVVP